MVRDYDDNEFPLAYFISFRTYGTWLHGDERGSVNRKQNKYGTPRIAPNARLQKAERKLLKHPPVTLDGYQRPVVENAIRGCVSIEVINCWRSMSERITCTLSCQRKLSQNRYCWRFRHTRRGSYAKQG